MKTLLVHYLPNKRSRTRILVDAFREAIGQAELEELNLCQDVPDLISPAVLEAYYARNDGDIPRGVPVPVLAKLDRMTAQLKANDVIVVGFPMYNFSMPATVKAWFDSVILQGDTFSPHPRGGYRGLMTDKKALTLIAASGTYSTGTDGQFGLFGPDWEHALSLAKTEFRFMGFPDIRGVLVESQARRGEIADGKMNAGIEQMQAIVQEWYTGELVAEEPVTEVA
jgi:FMN-dependent NADH-azoreductase